MIKTGQIKRFVWISKEKFKFTDRSEVNHRNQFLLTKDEDFALSCMEKS